ncbi:MAG TPA: hypothetical protein VGV39_15335 [Mesorhizobium sp.]|jgi:hypothetical protein|uniref:hypothetical protein n=1 Tax=Mesorhizobium sp. TaxID=1871066 RepID=UPI002DDD5043|nr:hypothetical protein [Mesorhizobium sp.]HEV2504449.1 hypothetical protein [Mesorhizobium sp.]
MSSQPIDGIAGKFRPDLILAGLLIFCVHYYAYVYFFPFHEGISAAPGVVKAIKDVVFLGSLIALVFAVSWKQPKPWQANVFWPFFVLLATTSTLHVPQTGWYDQVRENIKNVALFIPIYWMMFALSDYAREQTTKHFFGILVFASLTQSAFSFLFWYAGGKLWLDRVFVGFIANPNSFALMLNLATAALLMFLHRAQGWKAISVILLAIAFIAATIMRTTSGSQFAIFILLIAYSALLSRAYWRKSIAAAFVVGVVVGLSQTSLSETLYTFQNLTTTLSGANDPSNDGISVGETKKAEQIEVSQSVALRDQNIRQAFGVLSEGPAAALSGSYNNTNFVPMDGQFWVLLFNNGLLTLAAFGAASAFVFLYTLGYVWKNPTDETTVALHLMITAFGVTCLASRILMYFPFNLLFFMICGLAMARATQSNRQTCSIS